MEFIFLVPLAITVVGLKGMPDAISGVGTSSIGMSYCAGCSGGQGPAPGYVVSKRSPVYQRPGGTGFGHSTAYNYGVYPVQTYAYRTVDREGPFAPPPGQWGRKALD
jgi:hypothetical protein